MQANRARGNKREKSTNKTDDRQNNLYTHTQSAEREMASKKHLLAAEQTDKKKNTKIKPNQISTSC